MKPHKVKAYIMGFTLGCIFVGVLLTFRMMSSEAKEKSKFTFKPIPPEKLLASKDPIHSSLAVMANTKDPFHPILILEDIFPNEFIRVEESLNSENKLLDRKVLMADRLNLKLKPAYTPKDLAPILIELQAEIIETAQPQDNFFPIKLKSHSPYSLEIALKKLSRYKDIIASVEKIEFTRQTHF